MNKICVIIPVYNEEKNIQKLFMKIKKLKIKFDILYIEDNSTDNTRAEILKLVKKNKYIKYIFRKRKKGIGSAHKEAIKWCYKKKYQKILSMDADGTHDPKYIPALLKNSNNYDMVITSRFKNPNSIKDWPIERKFLTYARFWLTKVVLSINFDASGAYRCFETKKISLSDLINIKPNHYDYFFENIYKLHKNNYKIYELPINLPYRKLGNSKMELVHIFISLFTILKLRLKT